MSKLEELAQASQVEHEETVIKDDKNFSFELDTTKSGTVKNTSKNLAMILRNDENLKGLMAYNEFNYDIELIRTETISGVKFDTGRIDDTFTKALVLYLSEQYNAEFTKSKVQDTMETIARSNPINPAKDFMLRCEEAYKGDSDPLTFVSDYLGVEDSEYTRLVTEVFFRGAIAKVFTPKAEFDFALDLVGDQGTGKSRFLKIVFSPFFSDNISTFHSKDDFAVMVRVLAVEDAELVASTASGLNKTKKFVTQTTLEYRPPYGFHSIMVAKNFVIARTTNDLEHLKDSSGDRRFLPLRVKKSLGYKKSLSDLTTDELAQFWGGMMKIWREKSNNFDLTEEEYNLIERERSKFKAVSEVDETLEQYNAILLPDGFYTWEQWRRVNYIQEMLLNGIAYSDSYGSEIIGTNERDRVNVKDVIAEAFKDHRIAELSKQIRGYYQNNGWDPKAVIKFGKKQTSGYMKNLTK